MHVLVSGAAGFVGSHLVPVLAREHSVTALYRTTHPQIEGVTWRRLDFRDGARSAFDGLEVDAIVHLAQSRRYREFPAAARDIYDVNVGGTMALLEFAVTNGVGHFVMASTGSVYGAAAAPVSEQDAPSPGSFHAGTKLAGEALVRSAAAALDVCVLRLFYPYGPGQSDRLVPALIERVRGGTPVTLQGERGGLEFSPTYVSDLVDVFEQALRDRWTGMLNVGAPFTISIRDAAEAIGEAVGCTPAFEHVGTEQPTPLLPDLAALSARVDLSAFIRPDVGLRLTVNADQSS